MSPGTQSVNSGTGFVNPPKLYVLKTTSKHQAGMNISLSFTKFNSLAASIHAVCRHFYWLVRTPQTKIHHTHTTMTPFYLNALFVLLVARFDLAAASKGRRQIVTSECTGSTTVYSTATSTTTTTSTSTDWDTITLTSTVYSTVTATYGNINHDDNHYGYGNTNPVDQYEYGNTNHDANQHKYFNINTSIHDNEHLRHHHCNTGYLVDMTTRKKRTTKQQQEFLNSLAELPSDGISYEVPNEPNPDDDD
ncbi:hypothetical protein K438DRAFT_1996784 [Mycena galopus ATCC 62051]|nr:hypothetical protein K438DRAFT_1996784 [Mycena galopus ATCC 62051]